MTRGGGTVAARPRRSTRGAAAGRSWTRVAVLVLTCVAWSTASMALGAEPWRALYRGAWVPGAIQLPPGEEDTGDDASDDAGANAAGAGPFVADAFGEEAFLDLTLFDDGFAFARLHLAGRGVALEGSGLEGEDGVLRVDFYRPADPAMPAWAPDAAWSEARSALETGPASGRPPVGAAPRPLATLEAERSSTGLDDGSRLTGTVLVAGGERGAVALRRIAQYVTWRVTQGVIDARFSLPHFGPGLCASANAFLERGGLARLQAFVDEGRALADDDAVGWGWSIDEQLDVAGLAGCYLSLRATIDTYTGGAHPNTFFDAYLLELGSFGIRRLDLVDLFRQGTAWLPRLEALVLADLARQDAMWVVEGGVTALTEEDLAVYHLSPAGLTFTFAPYAMGPYVQGAFTVTVPFEEILDLAPEGGVLAAFATGY